MKKILLFLTLFFTFTYVNAYPKTFERTNDDLKVSKNVKINSFNKSNILKTPSVDANEKVYDFANILENTDYTSTINAFIHTYNMDMAILTIEENNKYSTREYGQDFYDYNDFGKEYKNFSGILLVIDLDRKVNNGQRNVEIVTTGDAIIMFDDERINNILDVMIYNLRQENYIDAVHDFLNKTSYYASQGIPSSNKNIYIDNSGTLKQKFIIPYQIAFCFAAIATLIISLVTISKNKMIKQETKAREYLKNANFIRREDKFINSHTTRRIIRTDSGGSSGGFSGPRIGGSSISRGSSGRIHGGGGRRF